MKKNIILAGLLLSGLATPGVFAKTMHVQVRSTDIRETSSFMARSLGKLEYGAVVTVMETAGAWTRVTSSANVSGWVHSSALTPKRVALQAGDEEMRTGVSADEVATAGKGFNAEVEGEFKKQNKDIDFTWIDRMEKIVVPPEHVKRFLVEGRLAPGGAP